MNIANSKLYKVPDAVDLAYSKSFYNKVQDVNTSEPHVGGATCIKEAIGSTTHGWLLH